jgi:hypothetical protein
MAKVVLFLVALALIAILAPLVGVIDAAFALPSPPTPPSPPMHGAPGPIVGAGLPVLAIGYGAYWLVRRYRRGPKNS